ncbi:MAG: nuclear transport factor 2 family protein [Gemmatimonadota bacterium]
MRTVFRLAACTCALMLPSTSAIAEAHAESTRSATASRQLVTDSADVVGVVTAFRDALARGDSTAALRLLAPDVIILEAGGVETLADYRSHHLPGDIAYARALPGVHTLKSVVVSGDAAWVTSTSVTEGQYNGRAVNSVGAELIVLARAKAGAPWMIRAVHWSSRRRTP